MRDGRCCRRRVALRASRRNFHVEAANRLDAGQLRPCRTADSIFSAPPALFASPLPLSSHCLFSSFSLSRLEFERIIIRGTRAHGLSSRGLLGVLSSSLSPTHSASLRIPLSLTASSILVSGSLILGRNLDLLGSYTTRLHAGGAAVPYYHTIFMLAPPGSQSCTTAHYTEPNPSCNVMYTCVQCDVHICTSPGLICIALPGQVEE